MRFGQIVGFVSTLAGGVEPVGLEEADDEVILKAGEDHVRKRLNQLGTEDSDHSAANLNRSDLLLILEELGNRQPAWWFGELVTRLTAMAQANLYDIEDDQLVEAARRQLENAGQVDEVGHAAH
jgi:hypothetical protein